ncbi:MAG: hydrogenase iron-sulfur subunit [Prevotella sp.]|jgi:coenzyme F420-reducing hydrogenase delta subunit|nr:hydrogenase iron-sulfur subunit [Prevotella sp.]
MNNKDIIPTKNLPKGEAGGGFFEPKILAFVCNWCTYAGADLTGTSRIKYASNVKIVRFPCTGRIDFMLLLKAFANGSDGVIVSGCHPNDCHYTSGNFHARRRWILFRSLLDFLGIDVRRIQFSWVSAAEGAKWADIVNTTVANIRELGPYMEYQRAAEFLAGNEEQAAKEMEVNNG